MGSHKRALSAIVVSPPGSSSSAIPTSSVVAGASSHPQFYSPAPSQLSLASSSSPRPRRPQSLYVPFQGCVEPPPAPPGRAARDILHALSYAPTHDRFSSQGSLSSCSSSWASSAGSVSPKFSVVLPCIPQSPPRKLRSKSSSLATLTSVSPTSNSRRSPLMGELPLSYSTQELVRFNTSSPLSPASTPTTTDENRQLRQVGSTQHPPPPAEREPVYSPTNPLNNSENRAITHAHPPVIHPPRGHQQRSASTVADSPDPNSLGSIKEASPSG